MSNAMAWGSGSMWALKIIHGWCGGERPLDYFSTIHHPGFQGFAPVCGCLFTQCQCLQPVEINPRVFHPHTTHGLFWEPTWTHFPMPWHWTSLRQSKDIFFSSPMETCYFSTIHHPGFQGFAPVCGCLFTQCQCLQPVEINPRVFHPHTTHGLFWEPTWTHFPMPWHWTSLHQSKDIFLSSPMETKALHLSPHACSSNVCNLWKLIQGSFTPNATHGLFWEPTWTHFPMPWHWASLRQSKDIFFSSPMETCYFSTIHHPGFQGFAPVSACLFTQCLQPVEINPKVFESMAWGGVLK